MSTVYIVTAVDETGYSEIEAVAAAAELAENRAAGISDGPLVWNPLSWGGARCATGSWFGMPMIFSIVTRMVIESSFLFVALRCEKGKCPHSWESSFAPRTPRMRAFSDSSSEELAWASMGDGLIGVLVSGEDSPLLLRAEGRGGQMKVYVAVAWGDPGRVRYSLDEAKKFLSDKFDFPLDAFWDHPDGPIGPMGTA